KPVETGAKLCSLIQRALACLAREILVADERRIASGGIKPFDGPARPKEEVSFVDQGTRRARARVRGLSMVEFDPNRSAVTYKELAVTTRRIKEAMPWILDYPAH